MLRRHLAPALLSVPASLRPPCVPAENILYASAGRWAGRAVAIDAVVQRRPPGGLMSQEVRAGCLACVEACGWAAGDRGRLQGSPNGWRRQQAALAARCRCDAWRPPRQAFGSPRSPQARAGQGVAHSRPHHPQRFLPPTPAYARMLTRHLEMLHHAQRTAPSRPAPRTPRPAPRTHPPMRPQDSACERLAELALNDGEVAGALLRQALAPIGSDAVAAIAPPVLREAAAAFQRVRSRGRGRRCWQRGLGGVGCGSCRRRAAAA